MLKSLLKKEIEVTTNAPNFIKRNGFYYSRRTGKPIAEISEPRPDPTPEPPPKYKRQILLTKMQQAIFDVINELSVGADKATLIAHLYLNDPGAQSIVQDFQKGNTK